MRNRKKKEPVAFEVIEAAVAGDVVAINQIVDYFQPYINSRYADKAITGTKVDKRDEFQRLIQDCMDGKIDMVIAKSLPRFARNTLDTLKYDHPFRLYEGDRLEDMVQSIKDHGVLNPVIVRKAARGYEMLAGHNRTNAAKIAGLTEVPAIVKTDLSDEDAYVYVIETNLLQRSFAELLPSEKAAVLVARYEKISSQGKRNDIRQEIEALEETCGHDVHKSRKRTCGHDVHKSQKSRDGLGEEYGMTGRNIARYMRLDRLIPEFKDAVDKGTLAMVAAVDLSYLNVKMQKLIQQVAEAEGKKLKPKQAVELRKMGKEITKEGIESVLAGKEQKKPQSVSVKLPVELYERYFGQMDAGAVQEIMEKALEGYFGKEAGVSTRLPGTLCTPSASQ